MNEFIIIFNNLIMNNNIKEKIIFIVFLTTIFQLHSCNDKEGKKSFFKISNNPATLIV